MTAEPKRRSVASDGAMRWFMLGAIALHLALFSHHTLTRTRPFPPDSMNYVDIARNIAAGKGIVQSTLGFNQPFLFDEHSSVPAPVISQPPLYPILIALLGRTGIPEVEAALLIPVIAYGLILLLTYLLARVLFSDEAALVSVAALLVSPALSHVSSQPLSEPLGIVFLLLSLWLLATGFEVGELRAGAVRSWGAGAAAGLAFGTRYALLPLVVLGVAFLALEHRGKRRWVSVVSYLLGAGLPIALVLGHNWIAAGQITPAALPSDRSLATNLEDAALSLTGTYFWRGAPTLQAAGALVAVAVVMITLAARRRLHRLRSVFVSERRYLLGSWVVGYTSWIVYRRSVSHFDPIDGRIMIPAGVILAILGAGLLLEVIPRIGRKPLYGLVSAIALVVAGREARSAITPRNIPVDPRNAPSERLRWIVEHTTESDLIIGDDAVDVPFYLAGRSASSFSPYPYTIHLTYPRLGDFAGPSCRRYRRIYLVLRTYPMWTYEEQVVRFGRFIADLEAGSVAGYPAIRPLHHSRDVRIFEVLCEGNVLR